MEKKKKQREPVKKKKRKHGLRICHIVDRRNMKQKIFKNQRIRTEVRHTNSEHILPTKKTIEQTSTCIFATTYPVEREFFCLLQGEHHKKRIHNREKQFC